MPNHEVLGGSPLQTKRSSEVAHQRDTPWIDQSRGRSKCQEIRPSTGFLQAFCLHVAITPRCVRFLALRSIPQLSKAHRVEPVKAEAVRNIVHRQRFKLKLGRSEVVLESKTTVPVNETGGAYVASSAVPQGGLAQLTAPHFQAWGPLLLQMGYKGFGRALSQINTRGFAHALTRERLVGLRIGHRALVAAGFVIEAWQMAQAVRRSVAQRSPRPATAQAARSLTTWGAVWAGVELFGTGGAMLGIPLGPAVVATTAIGATVGGCVGFFAGDWVARQIEIGREEAAEN